MLVKLSHIVLFLFGLYLLLAGFAMLFYPNKVRNIIAGFGKNRVIHLTELGIRTLIGLAFVLHGQQNAASELFLFIGYFLITTAVLLLPVPPKQHHQFAQKSARMLTNTLLRLCSILAFVAGGYLLHLISTTNCCLAAVL